MNLFLRRNVKITDRQKVAKILAELWRKNHDSQGHPGELIFANIVQRPVWPRVMTNTEFCKVACSMGQIEDWDHTSREPNPRPFCGQSLLGPYFRERAA
jgi:hypothetical protein